MVISGVCIVLALISIFDILQVKDTAIVLLLLAALPWVFPYISKFKAGDIEVEFRKKVEMMIDNASEPDEVETEPPTAKAKSTKAKPASEPEKVLQALTDSRYSFRTVTGLTKASKLPSKTHASVILTELYADGKVTPVKGKKGTELWGITSKGRASLP